MDWVGFSSKCMEYIKKYRYVVLVLLAGLFLMALPEGDEEKTETVQEQTAETEKSLQDSLAEILSQIDGAGKEKVLLTEAAGEETLYQTDEDITQSENSSDIRRETIIITNSQRDEAGLVQQVNPPVYQGAIIVCQGAGSASVRLAIVKAVSSVTGLTSDRITVLKMK